MRSRVDIGRYGTHSCLVCHRSPEVLWHIPSHICNGKPFRVFQRQCLHLVTAAPSYRLCKPRGHGGKRSQHTSNSHLDCGCVTLVAKETFEGKRQAM
ncbi:uncharacterized protein LOC142573248 isoform X2 [Dermacentor variabilis]|uniref:uncharacterized protein LOC142573248 isoform X2 n=1 Tax=Dermacentor variabilis TaxID=34621 RepID=UPI003F5C1792